MHTTFRKLTTKERKYLPLRFEPKQAYNLQIVFEFPITGTQDGKILSQYEPVGNFGFLPKYQYQFIIEDENGNYYDYNSSSVSKDLIDLCWTLPNFSNKPIKYIGQLGKIVLVFMKNIARETVEFLGFINNLSSQSMYANTSCVINRTVVSPEQNLNDIR